MSKNDDKIKLLLSKLEEQKAALGSKPKGPLSTNGIFKRKDGAFFNINTVKDPQVLVDALAYLLSKEAMLKLAAERLGVTSKFSWDGFTLAEWESDFKRRLDVITYDNKKALFDETKKKLSSLVSEEAKTEMELSDIEKLLS